jgi:RNA 3'-terminal phosphate cyclase (ATP)
MTDTVIIDGSRGEGGGQIVRSSLALSILTGRHVRIENMRARRDKAGLRNQHLIAVKAAAAICGAEVTGDTLGSSTLAFRPNEVKPGHYDFDVGTAGSTSLVLQTVLPPLLLANAESELVLMGGTHNPGAPIFDFLQKVYLPLINRMGPSVSAKLDRHGFYPAGGGRVHVHITPARTLRGFELLERGAILATNVTAILANLPQHIAIREIDRILEELGWDRSSAANVRVDAHGPGNAVWAEIRCEHVTELFASFGRLGVRAEQVGEEVASEVTAYLAQGAPVGPYLADQLLLPLGISAWQKSSGDTTAGGAFSTGPLTEHATTHIDILREFLGIRVTAEPSGENSTWTVSVQGA